MFFALIGVLFTAVFVGMQFGVFNVRGSIAERNHSIGVASSTAPCVDVQRPTCAWHETPEWVVIRGGLSKDIAIIDRVSRETGVSSRMIVAVVVPEQVRFFTSEREVFKRYFEPLKILGSLSQFSLGVSGIKQETADAIEVYASSSTSSWYPGSGMSELLSYGATSTPHDTALYNRLTDAHDHYYSYLYTALFIREIESQWTRAGFDISHNPGAVVTLFNIGFQASHPNASPQSGGASIATGGTAYTYGELGADFYDSNELLDVFPR
jgi:hypothetical protein